MNDSFHVTVLGIGAMGGSMARALLDASPTVVSSVTGYDRDETLVQVFWNDASVRSTGVDTTNTTTPMTSAPTTLRQAIHDDTNLVILALQNEQQCNQVCFGSNPDDDPGDQPNNMNLLSWLQPKCLVLLTSTVTATWARQAHDQFRAAGIGLIDAPVSGGPARARAGDLTLMVSGQPDDLQRAQPILKILGRPDEIHVIEGGAGMASTVKMVHQLLAGVHIAAAAEALTLAAKAGLNVSQLYRIVQGAAGNSWMFQDRAPRMMWPAEDTVPVKSQLQIFVKDLDIVYAEAKRLQSPIPLASTALQQFISGQSLGLSRMDDSQVVQVYEKLAGVQVVATPSESLPDSSPAPLQATAQPPKQMEVKKDPATICKEGDQVGDYWKMEDGSWEEILEVGAEPRHRVVLVNDYVRVLRVAFPTGDTTLAHRHEQDSLYFFLVPGGLQVLNHIQGHLPACDGMDFGEVRFGAHWTDRCPLVHKITNRTSVEMLCIDAEVLQRPPVTAAIPLVAERHELIKTRDKCRVYRLTLPPGEQVTVSYPFFHLSVNLTTPASTVLKSLAGGKIQWIETGQLGDVGWKEPVLDLTMKNVGDIDFLMYIAEWR